MKSKRNVFSHNLLEENSALQSPTHPYPFRVKKLAEVFTHCQIALGEPARTYFRVGVGFKPFKTTFRVYMDVWTLAN
jgi:hypothetical protein